MVVEGRHDVFWLQINIEALVVVQFWGVRKQREYVCSGSLYLATKYGRHVNREIKLQINHLFQTHKETRAFDSPQQFQTVV